MRAAILGLAVTSVAASGGCAVLSTARLTPEGLVAFGPPNAAVAGPNGAPLSDREAPPPARHVARSAFDRWQPPALGLLPPGFVLRNTSEPVRLTAGDLAVTLRTSDRLVPSWGGDLYVRVDLRGGAQAEPTPPRDLVVLVDTREARALGQARRLAAALFETLRDGDRGALVTTSGWGQVAVPLLPAAAAPLLIERVGQIAQRGLSDLPGAVQRAVPMLLEPAPERLRRLVLVSASGAVVEGEAREWIDVATRAGVEVRLVPLSGAAAARFEALATVTEAVALPVVPTEEAREREAIEELSALPPREVVARDVTLVVDSVPGPLHLIEVAGATPLWTPSGGEVPLGDVPRGDRRTVVLRGLVPPWRAGAEFEVALRVRYADAQGPHEVRRTLRARYSASPREYAGSRAGDVLQYVSLLNTLSRLQAALARSDADSIDALRAPATLQARSLQRYAREHDDGVMFAQSELMLQLLAMADAPAH